MTTVADELCHLSSLHIARIYDALHDLKDTELHEICMEILWQRHGVASGEWPIRSQEIGALTVEIDGQRRELKPRTTNQRLQSYCRTREGNCHAHKGTRSAPAPNPDDPGHRVARTLRWSYTDVQERTREFNHIQCLCGARSDRPVGCGGLVTGSVRRGILRADVWPTTRIPGINNDHPVFVVCKFSKGTQDPLHAPNSLGDRCLCGGSLGVWNEWIDPPGQDQYLSVQ